MGQRGPQLDRRHEERIREMVEQEYGTAAAITRQLEKEFPGEAIPAERTVRAIRNRLRPPDPSGSWEIGDEDIGAIRDVLDTLAAVLIHTKGRKSKLTRQEAGWVLRVRTAALDTPPLVAWRLAREYMIRKANNQGTEDLDACLAFNPWQRESALINYVHAVLNNGIPRVQMPWKDLFCRPEEIDDSIWPAWATEPVDPLMELSEEVQEEGPEELGTQMIWHSPTVTARTVCKLFNFTKRDIQ